MRFRSLGTLLLVFVAGPALADGDLTSMSLEDLSRMEVTAVSRKVQRLADTAAAVTVITAEDIARMGARSIPEALRQVPGVHAAQIAPGQWALSIRGFNGRFSNKLLVQIDGRSIYTPFFAGVFWEAHQLMLEDIERIEVVRGPGASLWGANAVNGVVNIVTRRASTTVGSLAWLEADDDGRMQVGARHGFANERGLSARVFARSIGFSEFEDAAGDGLGNAQHGWNAGFRADLATAAGTDWSLQGGAYRLRAPEQLQFPGIALGFDVDASLGFEYEGGHLMVSSQWPMAGGEAELRSYVDHLHVSVAGTAGGNLDTVDVDFQHRLDPVGRHEFIWGLGARHIAFEFEPAAPVLTFTKDDGREHIVSAFVQDEISLQPKRWRLTLGARLENNSLAGAEWQPNLRLLWTPTDKDSIWTHVSRASRTPSLGEQYARLVSGLVPLPEQPPMCVQFQLTCTSVIISRTALDRELEAEKLTAYELGYRRQVGAGSIEAVAYRHQFKDLLVNTLGDSVVPSSLPFPVLADQFIDRRNGGDAHVVGLEASFEMPVGPAMRLFGSYTVQNLDESSDAGERVRSTSGYEEVMPHQLANLRASFDIGQDHELDLMWRRVGALGRSRFGVELPAYQAMDLHHRWRVSRQFELALYVQNLFDDGHAEFAADFFPAPLGYAPRRAFLKGTATF